MLGLTRSVNLFLAGVLTGNEVGSWVVVHPALRSLPIPAHVIAERELTRGFMAVQPFIMSSTILSCLPVIGLSRWGAPGAFRPAVAGGACYVAMLASTLVGNIPINMRTLEASPEDPPTDWYEMRARWDRLHAFRALLCMSGFALLCRAATQPEAPRNRTPHS